MSDVKKQAIGIDLGTTLSEIAYVNPAGVVEVIPNQDGDQKTPSIVSVADSQPQVGRAAKPDLVLNPEFVGRYFKRYMSQVTDGGKPIPLLSDKTGRQWTAVDLAAVLLLYLKMSAEKYLGHPIEAVVICCPASFDAVARENTKAAALIAGFTQVHLVEEPVAAVTHYGLEKGRDETVVAVDFGGGTLDVTAIRVRSGQEIETLAIEGDPELGGTNYDEAIHGLTCQKLKAKGIEISPEKDLATWYRNLDLACDTKEMLSRREQATLSAEADGQRVAIELTRAKFLELVSPLDQRVRECCERLKAKLGSQRVDRVVLVGGSTRLPHIRALVRDVFGMEPSADTDPDLVVAKGAALVAAAKFGASDQRIVVGEHAYLASAARTRTVAAHDLCVAAVKSSNGDHTEYNMAVIRSGSPLPTEAQEAFAPVDTRTTAVQVKIVEGKPGEKSADSKLLNTIEVPVQPSDTDEQRIVVVMKYTDEGLLEVRAWDKILNKPQKIQFSYHAGLTQAEIEQKRKELAVDGR